MRLLSLELLRWGPFSDLRLDLSTPARGMHLVLGSNEAGKSTTLRAVTGLFFGIPERTTDGHRHKMAELLLGGRIQSESGDELTFTRSKGRKKTLHDGANEPLEEDRLRRFFGNIEQAHFETMFGLSHDRLVQGGKALVLGKGDLGESLFGAGLGQAGLSALLRKLDERADEIYKPRGKVRKLNQVIDKFKLAKKTQQESSESIKIWEDLNKERGALEASRRALVTEVEMLAREQRRLARVKRALLPIAERAEVMAVLESRRDDVVLPESASEDRRRVEKELREAGPRQEQLAAEIAEIESKVAGLVVPEALLDKATSVHQLAEDLGIYRKSMGEAAELRTALRHIEDAIRGVCERLGRDPMPHMAGDQVVTPLSATLERRVRELIKQRVGIDAKLRNATEKVRSAEERLNAEKRRGAALPASISVAKLSAALDEARREGDLDKRIREQTKEAERLGNDVRRRSAALQLYAISFDRIGSLPMPSRETMGRFEREFSAKDEEIRTTQRAIAERRQSLAQIATEITVANRGGEVPSTSDLAAARAARDHAWAALRNVALTSVLAESNESIAAFRAPAAKVDLEQLRDYESAVRRADDIADRLFREADRVARISEFMLRKNGLEREVEELEHKRVRFETEREITQTRWVETWNPSGLAPLSPTEMKDFLGVYEKLADDVSRWRDLESALSADRERAAGHSETLASLLADGALPTEGLARLIDRATAVCERENRAQKEREAHLRDLDRATGDWEDAQRGLGRDQAEMSQWATIWEGAVVDVGLPAGTGPSETEEILGFLAELSKRVQEAQDKRRRLANIERDGRVFSERTLDISQVSPEVATSVAIEQIATDVVDRFRAAQRNDERRRGLLGQLEDKRRELVELGGRRKAAESELEGLCATARVALAAELPAAEERSKRIRDLRGQFEAIERRLLDIGEGISIDALVAECHGLSGDTVAEELKIVQDKIAAKNDGKAEIEQKMGGLSERLASVDGSARAAEAAEEAEQHLASMAVLVEEYARAKLAHRLLEDEIKQYREKNQGPIIRRASELFERLTLGSFVGIRGDDEEGEEGRPVLKCVRPTGGRVGVDGLSDGTRDQLFFALRMASLERYFEHNEPIPFILDDILVNFDDARSRASLEILGELARKTQVLFFTHHARVVELAREALPASELRMHNLDELSKTARGHSAA